MEAPARTIREIERTSGQRLVLVESHPQSQPLPLVTTRGCHRCQNVEWVMNKDRRAKRCRCLQRKINRNRLAVIPIEQFGRPKLSRLQAREDIHPDQIVAVSVLKAAPDASYLLCGSNGTGKSHLAWALYRHAIASGRKTAAFSLNQLLHQYRDWELMTRDERLSVQRARTQDRPLILSDDLRSSEKHTLLVEEFEKATVTEFTSRMFFELLDAARDFGHQVVITSNKDWDQLRQHWSRIDETYGNSIMFRLQGCTLIEMF